MKPTPEQHAAIEAMDRSVCVDAGAGSGKTRVLIEHIVRLLESGRADLDEIAAITFTRKATGEIRDRLRAAFRKRAEDAQDEPALQSLWRERERMIDAARVHTIDGFCTALLKTHALTLGMDPEFTVLAESDGAELQADTAEEAFAELAADGHAGALLLAERFGAFRVIADLRRMLANATEWRGVIERYRDLGPKQLAELAEHDANTAFDELVRRFPHSFTARSWESDMRRYDGLCSDDSEGRERFRVGLLQALDDLRTADPSADSIRARLLPLAEFPMGRGKRTNWSDDISFDSIMVSIKKIKEHLIELCEPPCAGPDVEFAAAETLRAGLDTFEEVLARYDEHKRARTTLDFSDLLDRSVDMLQEEPDILGRVQRGLKHILIDEFQDTSPRQWDLARLLQSGGPTLFIVGDAKQSIYRFRGADVFSFETARGELGDVLPLRTNFRSTPGVLGFVNAFFGTTGLLSAVEREFHELHAHRADGAPECIEALSVEPDGSGRLNADSARNFEAEAVARHIRALLDDPNPLRVPDELTREPRPIAPRDIAILFRTRTAVPEYEAALREAGVPFEVAEGRHFFSMQEVSDLRNLIAAALNPCDELSLLAFLRSPLAGLSDDTLYRMARAGGIFASFDEADFQAADADDQKRLEAARMLMADLRARSEWHPGDWLREALRDTNYEGILLGLPHGRQKVANVWKLVEQAEHFGSGGAPRLRGFLHQLDRYAENPPREGEAQPEPGNAVTLMTVHQSKGLEFPVVYLADLSGQPGTGNRQSPILPMMPRVGATAVPSRFAKKKDRTLMHHAIKLTDKLEDEAEEARVLYVAMTRAKDRLVLCLTPRDRTGPMHEIVGGFLDLDARTHGELLEGTGWSCRFTRSMPPAAAGRTISSGDGKSAEVVPEGALDPMELPPDRTRMSVSALLNLAEEDRPPRDDLEPGPRRFRSDALVFGEAVHRFFELWDFSSPAEATFERVLREIRPDPEWANTWRNKFEGIAAQFRESELCGELRDDPALQRELPFAFRHNGIVIEGVIDALGGDGLIVDYKTGKRHTDAERRYVNQLRIYGHALRRLRGVDQPRAVLYYVESGHTEHVDLSGDADAAWLDEILSDDAPAPHA